MRWATYEFAGRVSYGIVTPDGIIDRAQRASVAPSLREAILAGQLQPVAVLPPPDVALEEVRLLPPVPDPGKIICVGMNYRSHRDEMSGDVVGYPTLFSRFADTQIGAGAEVPIPTRTAHLDYEGELAIVVGRHLYQAGQAEVADAIAGYSCYNDFSVRDWQFHTSQWLPGKNFPGTGAFGPWIVTSEDYPDAADVQLVTRVNGEVRQSASTADLIFSIPEIVAYVSSFTALAPGDVIVTGTPGGVGMRRTPPTFLSDGDIVEVTIDGIGTLVNTVRGWQASAAPDGDLVTIDTTAR